MNRQGSTRPRRELTLEPFLMPPVSNPNRQYISNDLRQSIPRFRIEFYSPDVALNGEVSLPVVPHKLPYMWGVKMRSSQLYIRKFEMIQITVV